MSQTIPVTLPSCTSCRLPHGVNVRLAHATARRLQRTHRREAAVNAATAASRAPAEEAQLVRPVRMRHQKLSTQAAAQEAVACRHLKSMAQEVWTYPSSLLWAH